jgi:uncharacterized protein (TIGR02145 family)
MKTQLLFLTLLFAGFASMNAQTTMNIYQSNGTVLQIPISSIDSITYTINNPGNLATLTTLPIGNITSEASTSGGSISSTGGSLVTQRGICWSTSQNPTTANNSTNDGNGAGSFTSSLTGLSSNTTYYVRAYAINSAGTAYGNQQTFTTINSGGIVSNPGAGVTYNGYSYSSIVLGNGQEWLTENLRTTQYNDGSPITLVTDQIQWAANFGNGSTLPMMCWQNNDQTTNTANAFGAMYNWYAVSPTTNGNRNVCPTGWHVPSDAEWTVLIDYLGGESMAGGKMKSTGTQYWTGPNSYATNESGFSGLPGGGRWDTGSFGDVGEYGYWWSSTLNNTGTGAWIRYLSYNDGLVNRIPNYKSAGYSVRCLRD